MTDSSQTSHDGLIRRTVLIRDDRDQPIGGAVVVRVGANGTFRDWTSDENGEVSFDDHYRGLITVLVASHGHRGDVRVLDQQWEGELRSVLPGLPSGGSIVFTNGTGDVPLIQGRLNPIRDSFGRTYIYGDNVSFNDSPDQPMNFVVDTPFEAEDALGNALRLTVRAIVGRTSLLDYEVLRESPLPDSTESV